MKRGEIALFTAIAAAFTYTSYAFEGFTQDDAYIFARYAHHLAHGNGFVYNIGEHTEGATSFLWTLLAALGAKLGADIPQFIKTAGMVSSVLWLTAFCAVCRQWLTRPYQWVLPVVLFAAFPSLAMWSQSGLEVCFFGFLATVGFYWAEAWQRSGAKKHLLLLCLTAILLILTRPEGLPVAFVYAVYLFFHPHAGKKSEAFRWYLPAVAVTLAALLVFRYSYFHDWVPNTYYAKGGGGYYLRRLGLGKFHVFLRDNWNWVLFAGALPVLFVKKGIRVLMLIPVLWAAYYINSGGDILPEHRLLLPAVPFMILGTYYFFDFIQRNNPSQRIRSAYFRVLMVFITSLFVFGYYNYHQQRLRAFYGVTPALERAHGEMGRYLNEHMAPTDKAVLTDAGMTAFYAPDKHMVDWLGLCDSRVARVFYQTGYNPWAMTYCEPEKCAGRREACHRAMEQYFDELRPRYVVLNVFTAEDADEQMRMIDYYESNPDTLDNFVIDRISFDGYFGVFTRQNRARGYKPVLVEPFNPNFWMILAEKPPETKNPSGMKGF